MQSKKKSVIREMEYNEAPVRTIPGMTPVVSINEHGFRVETLHFYPHEATAERARLMKLGYEVIGEVAA